MGADLRRKWENGGGKVYVGELVLESHHEQLCKPQRLNKGAVGLAQLWPSGHFEQEPF